VTALADPFDRVAYPRLAHREWVLMHQRGVSAEQIAKLSGRKVEAVLQYLRGVHQRNPELVARRPSRQAVYDRPQPRPDSWPDRDRRWKAQLAQLEAFLAEHGRRPYRGGHEHAEGRLMHWLTTQRSYDRAGKLPGHRARWLTEVLPGWHTDTRALHFDAQWRLNLAQALAFRTEHGKLPGNPAEPAERFLARWLERQRRDRRNGTLEADRRSALDVQLPGWDGDCDQS
jgi:hypothetical protein